MSQKNHNAFERLRGLLAEYADDDVDSVELVREVRERQYPPTVEPPMWSSPVYEHYHLTTFVVETDEMVELDLVKLDDPLSWGIVDSWCQFGGSSQTDMNSADGEIVTLSGGILARFREYIDAVIWAYQKIADIMGPIRIGRGAGIPNETLESLGWEDNIVSPRTPYDNREKTNDESWGKTDQGLFIQGAWITCAYDPENPLYPNAIVKEYRIGNILRGYIKFKARNDHEAWNKGRALMEEAIPSEGQLGRAMQLDVWQTIKTTAKMEDIEGAWFPVLIGQTKEPWPKRRRKIGSYEDYTIEVDDQENGH